MMSQLSRSPEVNRLAREAAEEISENPFFEAELDNPLEALEHYCRSHLAFQRLAYAQGIAAAALTARYQDCVEILLPLVEHLVRDSESEIRSIAVQQICGLGVALHKKDPERSLQDIESSLLVCAQQCALDDEEEVSQAAILAFQQLAQLLPAARATAASKRAVDRLESRGTDDGTLAAVRLLAHTVSCWTLAAQQRHVPRYINRWTNHRDFAVREAVGTCMSLVVETMPLPLCHQLLLPFFYQLCRDSNWRVRRACSMDLPRLAQALHSQQQQQQDKQQCAAHQHIEQLHQQPQQHIGFDGGSRSNYAIPVDGACCDKTSTCLCTIRFSAELGSLSTGNLLAVSHSGFLSRNRSSSAVNVPYLKSTAEIMTKHPMHSSLITEGLLSGTSPAVSTLASHSQPQQQSMLASSSDHEDEQHSRREHDDDASPAKHSAAGAAAAGDAGPSCRLDCAAPILHDCWCALRQCMELVSADSSHWVKVAAMSGLGPFLLLLPGCQVGQLLLGRFTSMASSTVVIYEISVALSCAQHFGPLAVRLGPDRWSDMRDAWQALQLSRDPAVLCELVKCLPVLVAGMGPGITCQELLPALAELLHSHLDWIASQLVAVIAELLELLHPSSQDLLLKVLDQLVSPSSERSKSWRLRRELALQLGRMAAAAGPEAVTDTLWPAAVALCCDPVAAVRSAAASQVGPMLAVLPSFLLARHASSNGAHVTNDDLSDSSKRSSDSSGMSEARRPLDVLRCNGRRLSWCRSDQCSPNKQSVSSEDDTAGEDTDAGVMAVNNSSSASGTVRFSTPPASADMQDRSVSSVDSPATQEVSFSLRFQAYASGGLGSYNSVQQQDSSRSSFDYEMDLPSALAPAPATLTAVAGLPVPASYSSHPALGRVISSRLNAAGDGTAGMANGSSSNQSSSSSGGGSSTGNANSGSGSSSGTASDSSSSSIGSDSDEEQPFATTAQQELQRQDQLHEWMQHQQQDHQQAAQQLPNGQLLDWEQQAAATARLYPAPHTHPQQQQSQPQSMQQSSTLHPAMMPIGHPAMIPVQQKQQQVQQRSTPRPLEPLADSCSAQTSPGKTLKAKSAGDLLKVEGASATSVKRRHSSTSMLGMTMPTHNAESSSGMSSFTDTAFTASGPEPSTAAPHEYIDCLVNYFGCSPHHQQRQLFVPLVMGTLAACHHRLTCEQAGLLLDRLEALAADTVPGVRYAVAMALQDLRQCAARLQNGAASRQSSTQPKLSKQEALTEGTSCTSSDLLHTPLDTNGAVDAGQSDEDAIDSYKKYVKELAACTPRAPPVTQGKAWDMAVAEEQHSSATAAADTGHQNGAATEQRCEEGDAQLAVPCNAESAGLEWLVKLSNCQQLERLMGVVALSTGA